MRTSRILKTNIQRHNAAALMLSIFLVSVGLLASGIAHAMPPRSHSAVDPLRMAVLAMQHAAIYEQTGNIVEVTRFANDAVMNAHEATIRISSRTAHGREAIAMLKEATVHLKQAIDAAHNAGTPYATGTHITSALDFVETAERWYWLGP